MYFTTHKLHTDFYNGRRYSEKHTALGAILLYYFVLPLFITEVLQKENWLLHKVIPYTELTLSYHLIDKNG